MSLIIDTDPGVDDALAIALACQSGADILGITTVFGNSSIQNSTRNALTILELLKKDIPVYQGVGVPLRGKGTLASSHGENGLGGFSMLLIRKKEKISAAHFLKRTLSSSADRSVNLVCIGPATNIALLFQKSPDLVRKVKQLILLGGVLGERGNITKYAEFNVYNDPEAFKFLLQISCKKIVIPINICRKVIFTQKDFEGMSNRRLRNSFRQIANLYIRYYTSDKEYGTFKGGVMYDLLAISFLLRPRLFRLSKKTIDVVLKGKQRGKTFLIRNTRPNCKVVISTKAQGIKRLFFES